MVSLSFQQTIVHTDPGTNIEKYGQINPHGVVNKWEKILKTNKHELIQSIWLLFYSSRQRGNGKRYQEEVQIKTGVGEGGGGGELQHFLVGACHSLLTHFQEYTIRSGDMTHHMCTTQHPFRLPVKHQS